MRVSFLMAVRPFTNLDPGMDGARNEDAVCASTEETKILRCDFGFEMFVRVVKRYSSVMHPPMKNKYDGAINKYLFTIF